MKKWILMFLLLAGCLSWLLHDPAPSEEEVVGLYTGTHNGYWDRVELSKDHKFTQILKTPKGETMESTGTWELTHKALDMRDYIFFIDEQVEGSGDKPIKTSLTFTAYREMLIRDWGTGFYRLSQQKK
jgi:hypothetical protein